MTNHPEYKHPITDHALLRYLERGLGLDLDEWRRSDHDDDWAIIGHMKADGLNTVALKEELLTRDGGALLGAIKTGAVGYRLGDVVFLIRKGFVISVVPADNTARRLHRAS